MSHFPAACTPSLFLPHTHPAPTKTHARPTQSQRGKGLQLPASAASLQRFIPTADMRNSTHTLLFFLNLTPPLILPPPTPDYDHHLPTSSFPFFYVSLYLFLSSSASSSFASSYHSPHFLLLPFFLSHVYSRFLLFLLNSLSLLLSFLRLSFCLSYVSSCSLLLR